MSNLRQPDPTVSTRSWRPTRAGTVAGALWVLFVLASGCGRAASASAGQTKSGASGDIASTASANTATHAVSNDYVIGPADVLEVSVWKQPDISRTVPVLPDGTISVPLIGQVKASGLTSGNLRDLIATKLKRYISDPRVNVIVEKVESHNFNILGKVLKPGSYGLGKPTTVLDAIALAGGFQDFAKVNKTYILRRMPDGSQKMLRFNYKAVIKGKRMDENLRLQPGDTIVVP
ncbi:MAG: polysaccharide biosynthesis/export family protein [Terriglobia bacterium]